MSVKAERLNPPPRPPRAAPRPAWAPGRAAGRSGSGSRNQPARREERRAFARLDGVEVVHHDDHRLGLPGRNQVVHDEIHVPLGEPAGLIFAPAVQQIQNGIARFGVGPVVRRRVDETAAPLGGHLGEIPLLADAAARYILGAVVVHGVGLGDLDSAILPAGSEEGHGGRVGDRGSIDPKAVVVESDYQRRGGHGPYAVGAFGHLESPPDADGHLLGVRGRDAKHRPVVRIDARVFGFGDV